MQKNAQRVITVFWVFCTFEEKKNWIFSQKAVSNSQDSCTAQRLVRVLGKKV
jgi:hypothetical protein